MFKKLGFYYFGATKLFSSAISQTKLKERWQAMILIAVKPPPLYKPLFDKDLYFIIESIYARRKRKEIPVLRDTIIAKY